MQKSKNLIGIMIGILLIIVLSIVLWTRDNTTLIDGKTFQNLSADGTLTNATMDKNYLYFTANGTRYKIAKDSIDIKSLSGTAISVKEQHSFDKTLGYLGIAIVLLLGFVVFVKVIYGIFTRQATPQAHEAHTATPANIAGNAINDATLERSVFHSNIKFDDIAGIKEVKDDLREIIDYLTNPQKYQNLGIHLPKGILLIGPPGVGKTMIAKAIASEANVPFFYQSGSSFAQIYVGVGAKRVRELFYKAKMNAPSIIFIDEIDAVGKARGNNRNDEREATLNELLTEMDGFEENKGVIVVGATNRAEILDSALLRAGRFDRRIYIDLPDLEERAKIIELYLRDKRHDVEIGEIAKQCVGFSGAAIASLVNEASLNALRRDSTTITNSDFYTSHDRVAGGIKKQLSFSDKEKEVLALYQAAKAISAYWCDIEFDKISLLGDDIKEDDRHIFSKTDLINRIKVALSGSVVLEMNLGEVWSNDRDDLRTAREIALQMCEHYAMTGRFFADINDAAELLDEIKDELKIFFTSAKSALKGVSEALLRDEKLTREELGAILKKEMLA